MIVSRCRSCRASRNAVDITLSHQQIVTMSNYQLKQFVDDKFGNHCDQLLDYFIGRKRIADGAWGIIELDVALDDDRNETRRQEPKGAFLRTSDSYHFYPERSSGRPFNGNCRLIHDESKRSGGSDYTISCDEIYRVRVVNAEKWANDLYAIAQAHRQARNHEIDYEARKLENEERRRELEKSKKRNSY